MSFGSEIPVIFILPCCVQGCLDNVGLDFIHGRTQFRAFSARNVAYNVAPSDIIFHVNYDESQEIHVQVASWK